MNKKLLSIGLLLSSLLSVSAEEGSNADESHHGSFQLPLSLETGIRFDSEDTTYGCRGEKRAPYFTISEKLPFSLFEGAKIYFSNENSLYVKDANDNSFDFHTGFSYDITDIFTGELRYTYTRLGGDRKAVRAAGKKDYRHAVRALLKAKVLLKPAIVYVHNFTLKRNHIKGTISHIFDLATLGANGFSIDLGAHLGYARTERPGGKKDRFAVGGDLHDKKKAWVYGGANADLVYAFNPKASARVGINVQGMNAKKAYAYKGHKAAVWGAASVDCSF
jgi:opacity protein-like surface antigen